MRAQAAPESLRHARPHVARSLAAKSNAVASRELAQEMMVGWRAVKLDGAAPGCERGCERALHKAEVQPGRRLRPDRLRQPGFYAARLGRLGKHDHKQGTLAQGSVLP